MKRLVILSFGLLIAVSVFAMGTFTVSAQEFRTQQPDICSYTYDDSTMPEYDFEFLGTKKNLYHEKGALEKVTVYFRNTGTIPMFSDDSGCTFRPLARLGTEKERDRESVLYANIDGQNTGWISPSRIKMDQKRVNPGEKGSFTFTIAVPNDDAIYREYFDIVLEGKKWMEKPFPVNFDIGSYLKENRDFLKYVDYSRRISQENLNGEKSIEVSIREQKMYLKVGDIPIRVFPVSTGKPSTPTPYGHTKILFKQEVRVAGSWPHYIMPKWLGFRAGGYGIHALPSLSFDNGYFWTEALNHIGSPRSHGCIRLLPQDAEFAYNFAEVGTPVWVR